LQIQHSLTSDLRQEAAAGTAVPSASDEAGKINT
tara:strand:- start:54 stop:155 length:102 start_codon:yes stop_codon:yes gene_type:complete